MTNIKEYTVTQKKVSVYETENQVSDVKSKKHLDNIGLSDRFYVVHILFFLLGLMHFLPYSFFITANAYWMDKFRNVSADALDATARTTLQSHFASASSISNSIPFTISILLNTRYGHKIKAKSRVLGGLAIITIGFFIETAFIDINTDTWQTLFFGVTMVILGIINFANATLEIGSLVLLSKFPDYFMKMYLLGEGCAGLFNAALEIITLAIGTSIIGSAILYFTAGTLFLFITLVLYYFMEYNKFYMHFIGYSPEDTKKKTLPYSEIKAILKVVWPIILVSLLLSLTGRLTNHTVTSLVVSENFGSGNLWSDVYFVPVITFFFADIASLLGRMISSKINKVFKTPYIIVFMIIRGVIFIPLIFLCNAQPRKHLPVLLPHDWQYITILGMYCLSSGYLSNMVFLSISKVVKPEKLEDAYMVFMAVNCTLGSFLSPSSLIAVDIL